MGINAYAVNYYDQVYNQLLSHKMFDMEIYYSGSGVNEEDTWILIKWLRPDWNYFISVGSPRNGSEYDKSGTEFRDALVHSGVIDWNIHSFISPTDKLSSKALLNMYVEHIVPVWSVRSWQLFYMKPEDQLKLDTSPPNSNVRLGPLTMETGLDFIVDNWYFRYISSRENVCKAVGSLIKRSVTGGVYVKDENGNEVLACGGVYAGSGELAMIHTHPDHRRKGYAALLSRYMFKEMAKVGLHGCVGGELHNVGAVKLYNGIEGLQSVQKFTFMCCEPTTK